MILEMLTIKADAGKSNVNSAIKLPPVGMESGTRGLFLSTPCVTLSCLTHWANLLGVKKGYLTLLMDLSDLAEINRTWLYKDLKNLSLTSNVKLAQWKRYASVLLTIAG